MWSGLALLDNKLLRFEDAVEPSSDYITEVRAVALRSTLASWVLGEPETTSVLAFRFLRSFSIDTVDIRCGGWVLVTDAKSQVSLVGLVGEILESCCSNGSFIRFLLREARVVKAEDNTSRFSGGVITVRKDAPCISGAEGSVVILEQSELLELHCTPSGELLVFNYVT